MSGKVVHFEIPIDENDRGTTFYRRAFGWELNNDTEATRVGLFQDDPNASLPDEGEQPGSGPPSEVVLTSRSAWSHSVSAAPARPNGRQANRMANCPVSRS